MAYIVLFEQLKTIGFSFYSVFPRKAAIKYGNVNKD